MAYFLGTVDGFEEGESVGEPDGQLGIRQVVKDMASGAALGDNTVCTEDGQLLRDGGMGGAEDGLEGIDVFFAGTEFFDDADAARVSKDTEEGSELFGNNSAGGHENRIAEGRREFKYTYAYMQTY